MFQPTFASLLLGDFPLKWKWREGEKLKLTEKEDYFWNSLTAYLFYVSAIYWKMIPHIRIECHATHQHLKETFHKPPFTSGKLKASQKEISTDSKDRLEAPVKVCQYRWRNKLERKQDWSCPKDRARNITTLPLMSQKLLLGGTPEWKFRLSPSWWF